MLRDPTRLVDAASGGNFYQTGHIVDSHSYPNPIPFPRSDQSELKKGVKPVKGANSGSKADSEWDRMVKVVGEFGGHGLTVPGHTYDPTSETLRAATDSIEDMAAAMQSTFAASTTSIRDTGALVDPRMKNRKHMLPFLSSSTSSLDPRYSSDGKRHKIWSYGGLSTSTSDLKQRYRLSVAALRELKDAGIAAGIYTQVQCRTNLVSSNPISHRNV
jgi:hypothetical protein